MLHNCQTHQLILFSLINLLKQFMFVTEVAVIKRILEDHFMPNEKSKSKKIWPLALGRRSVTSKEPGARRKGSHPFGLDKLGGPAHCHVSLDL